MSNLYSIFNESDLGFEPQEMTAGQNVQFQRNDLSAYMSEGYALNYYLAGQQGAYHFSADSTYVVQLPASTTQAYMPGTYRLVGYCELTVNSVLNRFKIYEGTLIIYADITALKAGIDLRSHARKMLKAIEDVMEGRVLAGDASSYSIAGRSITKLSPKELVQWRDYYYAEVSIEDQKERAARGEGNSNKILARFPYKLWKSPWGFIRGSY